jgi:hypothetical protein
VNRRFLRIKLLASHDERPARNADHLRRHVRIRCGSRQFGRRFLISRESKCCIIVHHGATRMAHRYFSMNA